MLKNIYFFGALQVLYKCFTSKANETQIVRNLQKFSLRIFYNFYEPQLLIFNFFCYFCGVKL